VDFAKAGCQNLTVCLFVCPIPVFKTACHRKKKLMETNNIPSRGEKPGKIADSATGFKSKTTCLFICLFIYPVDPPQKKHQVCDDWIETAISE
jgi:hypothetical protein